MGLSLNNLCRGGWRRRCQGRAAGPGGIGHEEEGDHSSGQAAPPGGHPAQGDSSPSAAVLPISSCFGDLYAGPLIAICPLNSTGVDQPIWLAEALTHQHLLSWIYCPRRFFARNLPLPRLSSTAPLIRPMRPTSKASLQRQLVVFLATYLRALHCNLRKLPSAQVVDPKESVDLEAGRKLAACLLDSAIQAHSSTEREMYPFLLVRLVLPIVGVQPADRKCALNCSTFPEDLIRQCLGKVIPSSFRFAAWGGEVCVCVWGGGGVPLACWSASLDKVGLYLCAIACSSCKCCKSLDCSQGRDFTAHRKDILGVLPMLM